MAIYRKETNPSTGTSALKQKAGLGIIDKILNKFSDNAVSNKAVSEEFERINQHLTELERRGAMPRLNYTTPLHSFTQGNLTYTATKDCYLVGEISEPNTQTVVTINGTRIVDTASVSGRPNPFLFIPINSGDTIVFSIASNSSHILDTL